MGRVLSGRELAKGSLTTVRVVRGREKPSGTVQALTLGGAVSEGGTSITVGALTEAIAAKNWLQFTDSNGIEHIVKVATDAAVGATSIAIEAALEAIPTGSTCTFPSEVLDRSDADLSRTNNTQDVVTFNTGSNRQIVAVTTDKGVSLPGPYIFANAGYRTLFDVAEDKAFVWVMLEYEPPNENFSRGEVVLGYGVVTDYGKQSPADGFQQGDISIEFTGSVDEILPVPV